VNRIARLVDDAERATPDATQHFEAPESDRPALVEQLDFQAGADQLFLERRLEFRINHGHFLRALPKPFLLCVLQREL